MPSNNVEIKNENFQNNTQVDLFKHSNLNSNDDLNEEIEI